MAFKVNGLGGVFFKSPDAKALGGWYRTHLGLDVESWGGAVFRFTESAGRHQRAFTVWSPFKETSAYFEPSTRPFMLNFRVENLDQALASLREAGVAVDERMEVEENGRFGWFQDPDGTRIELWEPAEPKPPGRSVAREAVFPISPEALFDLLVTPSAIREWWSASRAIVIPQSGGVYVATWGGTEDRPEYTTFATIEVFDRPRRLLLSDFRYQSPGGGLPFDARDLVTEFRTEPAEGGARLSVKQSGFPEDAAADEYFNGCVSGWERTFEGIGRVAGAR